jgi:hypothetical protein
LAYFDPKKWRLQPFGRYLGPIAAFPSDYQPGMAELFRKGNAIPIDFGLGYRWRRDESNLLLAQRLGPVDGTGVSSALTNGSDTPGAAKTSPKPRRKHSESGTNGTPLTRWFQGFPVLFGSSTSN